MATKLERKELSLRIQSRLADEAKVVLTTAKIANFSFKGLRIISVQMRSSVSAF